MSLRSYDLDASWDTLWCSSSGRLATRLCSSADTSVKSAAVLSSRQAASDSAVKHAVPGSGACRSPAARQYTSTLTCTPRRSMKTIIDAEHVTAAHGATPLHEPSNVPQATRRIHRFEWYQISKCSSLERLECCAARAHARVAAAAHCMQCSWPLAQDTLVLMHTCDTRCWKFLKAKRRCRLAGGWAAPSSPDSLLDMLLAAEAVER